MKEVERLLELLAANGPWPVVVLLLGALALILATFILVQWGRPKATLKLPMIVTIDLSNQIEEVGAPRQKKSPKIPPGPK
jgi:hypothetical protein